MPRRSDSTSPARRSRLRWWLPGRRYDECVLPDPAEKSVDAVRPIRDDIQ
jgi:hypothetical protein